MHKSKIVMGLFDRATRFEWATWRVIGGRGHDAPAASFDGYVARSVIVIVARPWMIFVEVVVCMPRAMMISTVGPTARKAFFMCLFVGIVYSVVCGTMLAVVSSVLVCIIVLSERWQRHR